VSASLREIPLPTPPVTHYTLPQRKVNQHMRSSPRRMLSLFLILLVLTFTGCAARPIHPGSPNKFDSTAYDTLLVADNVIKNTKADLAANKFPASITPNVITALNDLVKFYNLADQAYRDYHAAALAGTATPSDQNALQGKLNDVANAVTSVKNAAGGR
jgi:hypothetical protein